MFPSAVSNQTAMLWLVLFCLIKGVFNAQVDVEPREALVLPGQNVTFMCRVAVPLQYCRVEIPGIQPLNLNTGLSNPFVTYYGAGLSAGQCGFTLNNIGDKHNGQIKCYLGIQTESQESIGTMNLIVARAPRIPELDLSRGTDSLRVYKINDILQASCIVKDGRPVANITWFLDDEPLYRDGLTMPTVVELAKENLQSKVQNLTRQLEASDNGKHLRCVAYHPAYPNGRAEVSRQLDVKYAPLPLADLDKFGYVIGEPGLITVFIQANPQPTIEWSINGERIRAGENDQTGRIEAEAPRPLEHGVYEVNLRIARIRKEDTEKEYLLNAYNNIGTQMYKIKISTSPEPEGLELKIGTIIGIIVSILVVLLLVFLLIFAKITGRWCFSESIETRNFGETSDTESADVRPKEQKSKISAIKLTSFFKKNKQNAQQEEISVTEDETPKNDRENDTIDSKIDNTVSSKEGIVYAELDLISPNVKAVVKNDDDKTEYAEIVYTPNENNSNKP